MTRFMYRRMYRRMYWLLWRLVWRRLTLATELSGSLDDFHQEYPSTDDEAFLSAFRARATKGTTRRSVTPPNKQRLTLPSIFAKLLAYAESEGLFE